MVKKKFKQTKTDVKAMEKRMENIEKLLQTIVDINTTPRNEQAPDEDADDEDFGDFTWLYLLPNCYCCYWPEDFIKYVIIIRTQSFIHHTYVHLYL